jgi:hypothetical protein
VKRADMIPSENESIHINFFGVSSLFSIKNLFTNMSKRASSFKYSTRTIIPQRRARVPYSMASNASSGDNVSKTT